MDIKALEMQLKENLINSCKYAIFSLNRRSEYHSLYSECSIIGHVTGKDLISQFKDLEFDELCNILEVDTDKCYRDVWLKG